MSTIAFRNLETGFTAVKDYGSTDQVSYYQNVYDKMFGKGKYHFFLAHGFFKPYTDKVIELKHRLKNIKRPQPDMQSFNDCK